eukprot:scaffold4427_cov417-Prasinococcus_capsulatus_cf.AAC.3
MQELAQEAPDLSVFGYTLVRHLAGGASTSQLGVKLYRHTSGEEHAVKFICLEGLTENALRQAAREVRNQWRCDHCHVARIKWVGVIKYETRVMRRKQGFLLIGMEYAAGGELFSVVQRGYFREESEKRQLFAELLAAVGYLHDSLKMCHRDLKLENVLLDSGFHIKICDFGVSKSLGFDSMPHSRVGTPAYSAPEVVTDEGQNAYDGTMVDVWSLGVVLYILEYRTYPFGAPPNQAENIINRRFEGPEPVSCRSHIDDLLSKILVVDPKERLDIQGIWRHPWMGGVAVPTGPSPSGPPMQQTQEAELVFEEAERIVREYQSRLLYEDDGMGVTNEDDEWH